MSSTACSLILYLRKKRGIYSSAHVRFGSRAEIGEFIPTLQRLAGYDEGDHDRETIVVGNEPAVSGGFGSHVTTHNDDDAM